MFDLVRQLARSCCQRRLLTCLLLSALLEQILHGIKDMTGQEQWDIQMSQMPMAITQCLREKYGV